MQSLHMQIKKLLYLLPVLLMGACVTYTIPGGNTNVAAMYNPSKSSIHPEFAIQVQSDTSANVLVRIMRDEILFSRANADNKLQGQISIHSRVYSDAENKIVYDSLTVTRDIVFSRSPVVVSVLKLRIQQGKLHNVQLWVKDTKRLKPYKGFVQINNTPDFAGHRYYTTVFPLKSTSASRETLNFYPWIPDSFGVKVYAVHNINRIQSVSCYWQEFPLPKPPYLDIKDTLKLVPDTIMNLSSSQMALNKPGFYFFQPDSSQQKGVSVLHAKPNFPSLKSSADLIEPLSYLCSAAEMDSLRKKTNKKLAVDEFWMQLANDYIRAKQLIRVYYNRTKYANIYFTSYTEGWRTDRGMIFMLFGPPKRMYKTKNGERWTYGNNPKLRTLQFDFEKQENPYTNNHFVLQRKTDHRNIWRSALASWRGGKVYNGEELLIPKVYTNSDDIR